MLKQDRTTIRIPEFFDWHYYLEKNQDLRANGIHTEQQALAHWYTFGRKEDRTTIRTPEFFDWHYYLEKNQDLRANGIHTEQQALAHWYTFGKKEDRTTIRTPEFFDKRLVVSKIIHFLLYFSSSYSIFRYEYNI